MLTYFRVAPGRIKIATHQSFAARKNFFLFLFPSHIYAKSVLAHERKNASGFRRAFVQINGA